MNCLLVYDIPDDRARTKIADFCLDYGLDRIQYSAFVGNLSRTHQEELMLKIRKRLGRKAGNIQLFPVCGKDWENRLEWIQQEAAGGPEAGGSEGQGSSASQGPRAGRDGANQETRTQQKQGPAQGSDDVQAHRGTAQRAVRKKAAAEGRTKSKESNRGSDRKRRQARPG